MMKRRKFVIGTSLAGVGLATGTSYAARKVFFPNDKINIGVIGTGDRGTGLISILKEVPQVNVVACCDIIPFRLEAGLQSSGGKAKGYSDYREMLENQEIDAVIISVPFGLHVQIAIDALQAGKHIYCEKTMSKGFGPTHELVKAVRSSGKVFQVGHQYHSSRLYSHLVNEINNGLVGDITAIICQWNRNGSWRRPVPDPKWERMINWRMYREYSGGLTAELCSHQIDFTNWLLGETPVRVMGSGGIDYWKDGRETYDNVHLIMEYPSGVKAKYMCTTTNALGDYQIKVLGKDGSVLINYDKAWFFPEATSQKELGQVDGVSGATVTMMREKGYPIEYSHKDPSLQALLDFYDCVTTNRQPESNVISGGKAAILVQMALDAMDTHQVVSWDASNNLD